MSAAQETHSQSTESKKGTEQSYGFENYPERRGGKKSESWLRVALLGEGRENFDNIRCEKNVLKCVDESPLVKLMISALKSAGWWVYLCVVVCAFVFVTCTVYFVVTKLRQHAHHREGMGHVNAE